jgi:hypothetical protein
MISERNLIAINTAGLALVIGWMVFTTNWHKQPSAPPGAVCAVIPTLDEWYRANGYPEPPRDYSSLKEALGKYGTLNYYLHECQRLEKMGP